RSADAAAATGYDQCETDDSFVRPASRDLRLGERGEPSDLFLRGDHHRRLCAAIHNVRCRGPYLRPDGEDLRLRDWRRPHSDLYNNPGLERHPIARAD